MNADIEQLCKLLHLKHLPGIAKREVAHAQDAGLGYAEFLARVLRAEYNDQQARFTEARVSRARLPNRWSLDSFPYDLQPGVDRRQIRNLAQLDFV